MGKKHKEDEPISVTIKRNAEGEICAFTVENHGDSIVCAAVSMLVINTVNCIEAFTAEKIDCVTDQKQGLIACSFTDIESGASNHDANLLLEAMLFGLKNVAYEYKNSIIISD